MQPFGLVDDSLKDLLHHPRIQFAGLRPTHALREHRLAMPRITDALAVVLELERRERVLLTLAEQPDQTAIDGIDGRAYVGQIAAGLGGFHELFS